MPFAPLAHWQIYDDIGRRKYLSEAERLRFIDAAERLPRDRKALCLVLAYTGCRVSEALSLTHHQIDAERHRLLFRTLKRRRLVYREVPIPEPLCALLLALQCHPDGRLWRMHRVTAWRLVREVMTPIQISGPMSCPRGLRHGFGMHAAQCEILPNVIQRWMGHASPHTTAIYLDAVGVEERQLAERMW